MARAPQGRLRVQPDCRLAKGYIEAQEWCVAGGSYIDGRIQKKAMPIPVWEADRLS
jgi:hypothetical protein